MGVVLQNTDCKVNSRVVHVEDLSRKEHCCAEKQLETETAPDI